MPDATITSTASTFGTITGTFAADQSTITGTVTGVVVGTLDGSVGVPGIGVPDGGTTGQVLKKASNTSYDTVWGTDLASAAWGTITGTLSSQTDLQTALDAKAPLASPAFTGNPTAPTAALADNDTSIATTAFVQQELASGVAVAKNLEVYVRNQTGSTLTAGTIVYINGATGNRPTVTKAQANNDANSAQTFGFVKTSIANNGFGFVIVRGECENLDTQSLTEGAQLYLSPTVAGAWTTTKPSAPQHLVYVGIVVRSHPTQGAILVAIQNGYELNEIHDVALASVADSDLLAYDSATTLWKNKSFSTLGLATQSWVGSQGYLTSASLTGYATESWVTSQGYLTSSSLTGYAQLSGATFTGEVSTPASTTSSAGFSIAPGTAPTAPANGEIWNTGSDIQVRIGGVTETLAEQSWVTTQLGSYLTTSAASTTYAALAGATFTGLVSTPASTTTTAGLRLAHGSAPTTPTNGDVWTTTSGLFARINGGTQQYAPLGSTNTFSGTNTFTGANLSFGTSTIGSTINIGSGATQTGVTKAVNIGTSGVAGSTTNITIGTSVVGATSTTALLGTTTGVTAAVDTNTTALATTAFVVGQAGSATPLMDNGTAAVGTSLRYARQDHVHPTDTSRAPLASPALTGTPTAPTASVGTNTTQIATTAFVVGQGYAKLASPTFSGAPSLPTGTIAVTQSAGDNTTAVATTAFVQQEVPAASTTAAGKVELATNAEAIVGTSATLVNPLNNVPAITTRPELRSLAAINSTIVSGSGGATLPAVTCGLREMFLGSLAAGRSSFVLGQNGTGALSNLMSRADWRVINFSKKIWMSGKAMTGTSTAFGATNYIGDANTSCRITLGGYSTNTTGDMTQKGIGWKKVGGTSSYFTLTVHNGTTLTDVATTVQQSDNNVIDWLIYSDGTGNVTLYINGSQAATTAAGPTGNTTVSYVAYREQVEAVSTPTVRQIMECTGGWLYIEG